MLMVALAVEPMGWALESPGALPARRVWPEVLQRRPAPQPQLRRPLVAVQAPARVNQAAQPVHRPVHRIARPMASRMVIGHRVRVRLGPQLLQHLAHRGSPGPGGTPAPKLAHEASELLRGGGTVDVPDPTMQVAGLAAA